MNEYLHTAVGRTATPFRRHPVDILRWIFDVARFTVDAILSVDLKTLPIATLIWHILVNAYTLTEVT